MDGLRYAITTSPAGNMVTLRKVRDRGFDIDIRRDFDVGRWSRGQRYGPYNRKKQDFLIPQEKKSYDFSLHLLARIN